MSNSHAVESFLTESWARYVQLTPDAPKIHSLLESRGDLIINDHIAIRTFNLPGISRLELGARFEPWGYRRSPNELDFPEKKLTASYWLPPLGLETRWPKIFISELRLEDCSPLLAHWIRDLVEAGIPSLRKLGPEIFLRPSWPAPRFEDYSRFLAESEYATWTAAFGIQLNHFTVFVNSLKSVAGLAELNHVLQSNGFLLSTAGGVIKGNAKEMLEQSSTRAREVPYHFAGDRRETILGCYYEFAQRHPDPNDPSGFFQGFVPASANKIFESTFAPKA